MLTPNIHIFLMNTKSQVAAAYRRFKMFLKIKLGLNYSSYKLNTSKLSYVVNKACQYMTNPQEHHWKVEKCIFRYLVGTLNPNFSFVGVQITHFTVCVMLTEDSILMTESQH